LTVYAARHYAKEGQTAALVTGGFETSVRDNNNSRIAALENCNGKEERKYQNVPPSNAR